MRIKDPSHREDAVTTSSANPRNLPCPTCHGLAQLTASDVEREYQCDTCDDLVASEMRRTAPTFAFPWVSVVQARGCESRVWSVALWRFRWRGVESFRIVRLEFGKAPTEFTVRPEDSIARYVEIVTSALALDLGK